MASISCSLVGKGVKEVRRLSGVCRHSISGVSLDFRNRDQNPFWGKSRWNLIIQTWNYRQAGIEDCIIKWYLETNGGTNGGRVLIKKRGDEKTRRGHDRECENWTTTTTTTWNVLNMKLKWWLLSFLDLYLIPDIVTNHIHPVRQLPVLHFLMKIDEVIDQFKIIIN